MMNQNEQTKSATAVAVAVFDLFHPSSDEVVFEVSRAAELIQAYGDRRAREAFHRPSGQKVVPLRLVRRADKLQPRDCF